MSDTPSLTDQLASRVRKFASSMNLSQRQLCEVLNLNEGTFSRFLSGKVQLLPEDTLKVLRLISLSRRDLDLKLCQRTTSKIQHLQVKGEQMTFAVDGWVPRQSGVDPDGGGIDAVPTARDVEGSDDYLRRMVGFLKQQQEIYRSAISHIDDYLAKVTRGKTEPRLNGIGSKD